MTGSCKAIAPPSSDGCRFTAPAVEGFGEPIRFGRNVGCWHKADIDRDASECPLSGVKQTFRNRLADVRF